MGVPIKQLSDIIDNVENGGPSLRWEAYRDLLEFMHDNVLYASGAHRTRGRVTVSQFGPLGVFTLLTLPFSSMLIKQIAVYFSRHSISFALSVKQLFL